MAGVVSSSLHAPRSHRRNLLRHSLCFPLSSSLARVGSFSSRWPASSPFTVLLNPNRPEISRALHLRFEKGMVGLSFCDFVGTREEKARMAEYKQKEWGKDASRMSHLWQLALQKRKESTSP